MKVYIFCVVCIVSIYGLFSSSTPDKFGTPEFLLGMFLLLFCSLGRFSGVLGYSTYKGMQVLLWFRIFFIVGLLLPTLVSIVNQDLSINNYVRDLIPFLYNFIFLFALPSAYANFDLQRAIKFLSLGLVFVGLCFSARYFLIDGVDITLIGRVVMFGDLNYFPMDPAVTFASIYSLLQGLRNIEIEKPISGFVFLVISIFCFAALVGMMVRAPIILYFLVFFGKTLFTKGSNYSLLLGKFVAYLIILLLIFSSADIFELVVKKFEDTGWNSKDAEIYLIANTLFQSPWTLLFGFGWGGTIESPAVGVEVRYVHNFIAYYSLKIGLIGFIMSFLFVFYIYAGILKKWLFLLFNQRTHEYFLLPTVGGVLAALSSSFFLQANFKSLSFGLLILASMYCLVYRSRGTVG